MASSNTFDVAIAGAGPAGTSLAIELALWGAHVLLIEEKKFPRAKLCGEFISPECLTHFKRLGVMDQMSAAGGASVAETVFYSRQGNSVSVPSEWFKSGARALGLSRSEMDHQLLEASEGRWRHGVGRGACRRSGLGGRKSLRPSRKDRR